MIIKVFLFLVPLIFLGNLIWLCDDGMILYFNSSMQFIQWFRLQKRIYIPLPESNERQSIFKKHLGTTIPNVIKADEWIQLGQKSEGLV